MTSNQTPRRLFPLHSRAVQSRAHCLCSLCPRGLVANRPRGKGRAHNCLKNILFESVRYKFVNACVSPPQHRCTQKAEREAKALASTLLMSAQLSTPLGGFTSTHQSSALHPYSPHSPALQPTRWASPLLTT